jgi:hypothetical protein
MVLCVKTNQPNKTKHVMPLPRAQAGFSIQQQQRGADGVYCKVPQNRFIVFRHNTLVGWNVGFDLSNSGGASELVVEANTMESLMTAQNISNGGLDFTNTSRRYGFPAHMQHAPNNRLRLNCTRVLLLVPWALFSGWEVVLGAIRHRPLGCWRRKYERKHDWPV